MGSRQFVSIKDISDGLEVKAGVPVSSISRMLRHKDIKVTMIYLETLGLHEDKALNALAW